MGTATRAVTGWFRGIGRGIPIFGIVIAMLGGAGVSIFLAVHTLGWEKLMRAMRGEGA